MGALMALGPPVGLAYLRLMHLIGRYRIDGLDNLAAAHEQYGNCIWAVWHNRLLGGLVLHGDRDIGSVISQSTDGELLARAMEKLGYVPLRGSSSRGGVNALKGVMRHLKSGKGVAFTPDGPRGPRFQVHPGLAHAAQRTGRPVLPIGFAFKRKIVFNSWDLFQAPLPIPFNVTQVVYGKPLTFSKDDDTEAVRSAVKEALDSVAARADELLGVTSP